MYNKIFNKEKIPCFLEYENFSTKWLYPDDEENFQKNQINGLSNGYGKNDIIYSHNEASFRTHQFDFTKKENYFLGCSIVKGIGIRSEETFVSLIEKEIQESCYNLGVGGNNNNFIFLQASNVIQKKIAKLLVVSLTFIDRDLFFDNDKMYFYGSNFVFPDSEKLSVKKSISLIRNFDETRTMINLISNIKILSYISSKENLKVIFDISNFEQHQAELITQYCPDSNIFYHPQINDCLARDHLHPGPIWHNNKKNNLINFLKQI